MSSLIVLLSKQDFVASLITLLALIPSYMSQKIFSLLLKRMKEDRSSSMFTIQKRIIVERYIMYLSQESANVILKSDAQFVLLH